MKKYGENDLLVMIQKLWKNLLKKKKKRKRNTIDVRSCIYNDSQFLPTLFLGQSSSTDAVKRRLFL